MMQRLNPVNLKYRVACMAAATLWFALIGNPAALHAAPLSFSGSALPLNISSGGVGTDHVDISQLTLLNTPDGFKVTGLMTINLDDLGFLTGAFVQLDSRRFFDAPLGTPITPAAHISGFVSTTGDALISGISGSTILNPTPGGIGVCGADVSIAFPSGTFSQSFTGNNITPANPCGTVGTPQNQLDMSFGIAFTYSSAGSITLNFGNSILSEGTVVPQAVPEPSTVLFVGMGLALCTLWRKR